MFDNFRNDSHPPYGNNESHVAVIIVPFQLQRDVLVHFVQLLVISLMDQVHQLHRSIKIWEEKLKENKYQ